MKLQKQFAYNYKGKKHCKSGTTLLGIIKTKLGWEYGQELESEVKQSTLIIGPMGKAERNANE